MLMATVFILTIRPQTSSILFFESPKCFVNKELNILMMSVLKRKFSLIQIWFSTNLDLFLPDKILVFTFQQLLF